ncbi:MAG: c-type cytochrome [Leptospirillum sp.]|jgi:cytochrome c|nr:c-type cytochrome [Nitrospiraceae bacterium]
MNKIVLSGALFAGLLFTQTAQAGNVQKIMGSQDCASCHSVDQKLVGPSFKMIADRYRGKKGVVKVLAQKIITGGGGNWTADTGGMAMPPHPGLPLPQAEEIVKWILSQK